MPGGDHFYTTSVAERDVAIAQHDYLDEGIACYLATKPSGPNTGPIKVPPRYPLHRLYRGGGADDHLYICEYGTPNAELTKVQQQFQYQYEGIAGYIYATQASHRYRPLLRLFSVEQCDHFYTTDPQMEGATKRGYEFEGAVGWVRDQPSAGTAPLYRLYRPYEAAGPSVWDTLKQLWPVGLALIGGAACANASEVSVARTRTGTTRSAARRDRRRTAGPDARPAAGETREAETGPRGSRCTP